MITDSQVHIWEVDRPDRPWPPARNRPQLPDGYSADQMLAAMDATGVDRAVIVPPTWVGENNATALEAAAKYPARFAVMGRFDPQAAAAREQIEGWLKQPHMLGVRMTSRSRSWLSCRACLASSSPSRRAIPVSPSSSTIWASTPSCAAPPPLPIDDLLALAAYPRVVVKTSSAPCFSNEPYPFRDIYPYLRRIYDAFGPRRMLWGADLTRLTSTYSECLLHFKEGLDFLFAADKEWVLGKALAKALRWPEA
jgi:predicted TIM-barrel fold metal-dependent hydrolase